MRGMKKGREGKERGGIKEKKIKAKGMEEREWRGRGFKTQALF